MVAAGATDEEIVSPRAPKPAVRVPEGSRPWRPAGMPPGAAELALRGVFGERHRPLVQSPGAVSGLGTIDEELHPSMRETFARLAAFRSEGGA
jgi:hypothetical protein